MAVLGRREKAGGAQAEPRLSALPYRCWSWPDRRWRLRLYYLQIINTSSSPIWPTATGSASAALPAPARTRLRPPPSRAGRYPSVLRRGGGSRGRAQSFRDDRNLERYLGDDHAAEKITQAQDDGRPPFDPVTVKERLTGIRWSRSKPISSIFPESASRSRRAAVTLRPARGPSAGLRRRGQRAGTQQAARLPHGRRDRKVRPGARMGGLSARRQRRPGDRGRRGRPAAARCCARSRKARRRAWSSRSISICSRWRSRRWATSAGAVVAIDPNTGEILAMVSHPTFDPNVFASGITRRRMAPADHRPDHPLQDRAIQGTYPPGSTFKIVDTIAGLEERTLTDSTAYYCPGGHLVRQSRVSMLAQAGPRHALAASRDRRVVRRLFLQGRRAARRRPHRELGASARPRRGYRHRAGQREDRH